MKKHLLLSALLTSAVLGQTPTSFPLKLNDELVFNGNVSGEDFLYSPDSARILYRADQNLNERFELFSVASNGGAVATLNTDLRSNGDVTPFGFLFSPDSSRVIYHADQDLNDQFELYSVLPIGGPVTQLNDNMIASGDVTEGGFLFSPDSSRVLYHANQVSTTSHNLYYVRSSGGTTTRLNSQLAPNETVSPTGFQFSPDGSRMIYHSNELLSTRYELFTALTVGSPLRLNPDLAIGGNVEISGLQYSPDGSRVIYRADQRQNELFELFMVASDGDFSFRLSDDLVPGGDVQPGGLQFSPSGSHVLYLASQRALNVVELFSVDINRTTSAQRLSGNLIAGGDVIPESLQYSPDGSRVLYLADQLTNGKVELFSVASFGGPTVRLNLDLPSGGEIVADSIRVTADSSRVLYLAQQEFNNRTELYLAPITGTSNPTKINAPLPAGGNVLSFELQNTAQGERVVYLADQDAFNVVELFTAPLTPGLIGQLNAPLVAGGDVSSFRISPDGQQVAYVADQVTNGKRELFVTRNQAVWQTSGQEWFTNNAWLDRYPARDGMTLAVHTGEGTMRVNSMQVAVAAGLELGSGSTSGPQSVLQFENDSQLSLAGPLSLYRQAVIKGSGHLSAPNAEIGLPFRAEVQVGVGETLKFTAASFKLDGTAKVIGSASAAATWEVEAPTVNDQLAGLITAEHARLIFPQGLTNAASIHFQAGSSVVSGPFASTGSGLQSVSAGAEVAFQNSVRVAAINGLGKVTVEDLLERNFSPGLVSFGGDLALTPSSTLRLQIGGTAPASEHDQVAVIGGLTLDGGLEISLANSHLPSLGDRYLILSAASITGSFASYTLPALAPGLYWQTSQLTLTGELLVGNFPDRYDRFVDTFSLTGSFEGDDDSDGIANGIEYVIGTNPTVPNPETLALELTHTGANDALSTLLVHPAQRDVNLAIETSTNLQNGTPGGWIELATRDDGVWSSSPTVTVTPQSDGRALAEVSHDATAGGRRFYRLKVTLAP